MRSRATIDLTTDKGRDRFYSSPEWKAMRLIILSEKPFCVKCLLNNGIHTIATEIDHIIDIKVDKTRFLDITNLQPLCKSCHSAKTFEENREKSSFGKKVKYETVNKKWKKT